MLLRWLACLTLATATLADQHVLLDTTKESMLDWKRYPYGPNSSTAGWVEESFTKFEKNINWRTYVVCDLSYPNVNNWLWTPFIQRNGANRIYIEVKFSLRNCDLFPGNAVKCKETFSLLYYEFDAATREPPPWEPESYKLIDRIAADEGRFTKNDEIIINTETRSVETTHKGLYFAFQDQGACLSLLSVKVYYLTCPEITVEFAHYPETATGSDTGSVEKVLGQCVENSVPTGPQPSNLCKSEGLWIYHTGGCACMAGYEADEAAQKCKACPVGRFKHQTGNGACLLCPAHSQALFEGSVECRCNEGYYRAPTDPRTADCTRPPGSPRNLTFKFLDATTLLVKWDPPADEGNRADTSYKVDCLEGCGPSVVFEPASPTMQTQVTVTNLDPLGASGGRWTLRVFATNGVSAQSLTSGANYADITVTPDGGSLGGGVGGGPVRINVDKVGHDAVRLSWKAPLNSRLDIDVYEVKYFKRGHLRASKSDPQVIRTTKHNTEVKDLSPNTEYVFQVRAQTAGGSWSPFSMPAYATTDSGEFPRALPGEDSEGDDLQVKVAIGVIVAVVLVMALTTAVWMYVRRGNQPGWSKQGGLPGEKDCCDSLDYRGLDPHFTGAHAENLPIVQTHTINTLAPPYSGHVKTYVDPHTYEDPHVAVRQFAKEIDSRFITIEAIIGGGEFGDVCRGRLSLPADRANSTPDMLVAIKTLKPGSTDKARMDFLTEASIMGQFEHPNVIFLQGVVTKAQPTMIITEYMENGSLDTFLRANDGKFQVMQLVGMMRGIAYGMQYLSEMSYVHRDLAARNVLVNSQLVCKIADFGLSREIGEGNVDGAYTTRGGKIPVRWTAPEAIAFRKFTSSSDVWSFGIVMWEVMSCGERPYWTWSNQDVIKAIEKGYRLPAPMDCPEAIHQLMLDCWQKERSHRPTFVSIVKTLDKLICCPDTLKKIANSPIHNPFAAGVPDYSAYSGVPEWLESLKMSRYSDHFAKAGVLTMESVAKLSLPQLVEIGVTLVGHQKKIMGSIHAMRAQMSVNMSEGFLV